MKSKSILTLLILCIVFGSGLFLLLTKSNWSSWFGSKIKHFDYIQKKVENLDSDPLKIEQYISQGIALEKYKGYLRGPLGTLWGESGNEIDKLMLLKAMLDRASVTYEMMEDKNTGEYALKFKTEKEWHYYPAKTNWPQKVDAIAPKQIHRVQLLLLAENKQGRMDVVMTSNHDTADMTGMICDLKFEKSKTTGIKAALYINDILKASSSNLGMTPKSVLRFNVRDTQGDVKTYERILFDKRREVGHRQLDYRDRYVVAIQPSMISTRIARQEVERYRLRLGVKERLYLMNLAHMSLSDAHSQQVMSDYLTRGNYHSPRIIIAAREIEKQSDSIIQNVSLDLLKNEMVFEKRVKQLGFIRGIAENEIGGKVVAVVTGQCPVTTSSVFNELFGNESLVASSPTVPKRLELYGNAIDNMLKSESSYTIEINYNEHVLRLMSNKSEVGKVLFLQVPLAAMSRLEKKGVSISDLDYNEEEQLYSVPFQEKSQALLATVMDSVFLHAYQAPIQYRPGFRIIKTPGHFIRLSRKTNKLDFLVRKDGKPMNIRAFVRGSDKQDRWNMEWLAGKKYNSNSIRRPPDGDMHSMYGEYGFNEDYSKIKNIWVSNRLLKEEYPIEGYILTVDGQELEVAVRRATGFDQKYRDHTAWILDDMNYPLVLKYEAPNYYHQLKTIVTGQKKSTLKGQVFNKTSGRPLGLASIAIDGKDYGKAWDDGTFELVLTNDKPVMKKSLMLIVDNSKAMNKPPAKSKSRVSKARITANVIKKLVGQTVDSEVEMYLGNFSVYYGFTNFQEMLIAFIDKALSFSSTDTPLSSSLDNALKTMKNKASGYTRGIVLITAGDNTDQTRNLRDVYEENGCSIPVYPIGFSVHYPNTLVKELKMLAQQSGGQYFSVSNESQLYQVLRKIAALRKELKSEYTISAEGYLPAQGLVQDESVRVELESRPASYLPDGVLKIVTISDQAILDQCELRRQSKNLIKQHLKRNEGLYVIVPQTSVALNNMTTSGWWEIYPKNGQITGVTEDGLQCSGFLNGAIGGYAIENDDVIGLEKWINMKDKNQGFAVRLAKMHMGNAAVVSAALETTNYSTFTNNKEWIRYLVQCSYALSERFGQELKRIDLDTSNYYTKAVNSIIRLFEKESIHKLATLFVEVLHDQTKPAWNVW